MNINNGFSDESCINGHPTSASKLQVTTTLEIRDHSNTKSSNINFVPTSDPTNKPPSNQCPNMLHIIIAVNSTSSKRNTKNAISDGPWLS